MLGKIIFCLTLYLMISSTLQGDLLKCMKQSATIIGEAATLIADIESKNSTSKIAIDINSITNTIKLLIDSCNNPICLTKATDRCNAKNTDIGCEQWGAIMYPKCRKGFYNAACCICSQDCPSGFRDDGLYCKKPEPYGRGAG